MEIVSAIVKSQRVEPTGRIVRRSTEKHEPASGPGTQCAAACLIAEIALRGKDKRVAVRVCTHGGTRAKRQIAAGRHNHVAGNCRTGITYLRIAQRDGAAYARAYVA